MAYFSRLTDIVTCNLSSILARAENAVEALQAMIPEMEEGLAGAERCVKSAAEKVSQLESEIGEQRHETENWKLRAQAALEKGDEPGARNALGRKHEVEDLIAGLEQQLQAAVATRDHMLTTRQALQARLADARRRLTAIQSGANPLTGEQEPANSAGLAPAAEQRSRIDAELEELRRQMKGHS